MKHERNKKEKALPHNFIFKKNTFNQKKKNAVLKKTFHKLKKNNKRIFKNTF